MQAGTFIFRLFSSCFFAAALKLIWRGLDGPKTNLQRSSKSLSLHLAYLFLFLLFEAINLYDFAKDYES